MTFGCSFTLDNYQKTWANFLAEQKKLQLINCGARGAGVDFISKRLVIACQNYKPKDSLIAIMLPSRDRFDLYVEKNDILLDDYKSIASWQDGNRASFMELDGNLSEIQGYSLTGGEPRGYKKYWYKYFHNNTFSAINYWFSIYHMQNFLKLHKYNYFFTSAYDIHHNIEQSVNQFENEPNDKQIMSLIDFEKFILYKNTNGFLDFCSDQNYEIYNNHPVETAHQAFVNEILYDNIKS